MSPELMFQWLNVAGGAINDVATNATAVHPDWRCALATVEDAVAVNLRDDVVSEAGRNMSPIFGDAMYYNTASGLEEGWQDKF